MTEQNIILFKNILALLIIALGSVMTLMIALSSATGLMIVMASIMIALIMIKC